MVRLARKNSEINSFGYYYRLDENKISEISARILADENQPLCGIINNVIEQYNNSRKNRFTFFGLIQHSTSERNVAIDQLRAAYTSYKTNYWSKSRDDSMREFLTTVIDIRNRAQTDHLQGSRFAIAGLTRSRLVQEIDNALTQCVHQGICTDDAIRNLQQTAVDYSPTCVATFG